MLNHRNQDGSGRNQVGRWRWMRPVWVLYKKLEGHILGFPDSNPFDPRSTVTIHTTHHTTKTYTTNKIRILPRHTVCVGVRRVSLAKDKINPEIPSSSRPGRVRKEWNPGSRLPDLAIDMCRVNHKQQY